MLRRTRISTCTTAPRNAFVADAVVLCGGGHTRIWRRSSSRRYENFGEAIALALRVGCRTMDLELVQFHPTGMGEPREEAAGTLVTEAVRGEGGHLYNACWGERFMVRYDETRMELSTRDHAALANYTEIAEGRVRGPHGGVFLDITHIGKDAFLRSCHACTVSSSSTRCSTSRGSEWKSCRLPTTRWVASWSIPRRMPPT